MQKAGAEVLPMPKPLSASDLERYIGIEHHICLE